MTSIVPIFTFLCYVFIIYAHWQFLLNLLKLPYDKMFVNFIDKICNLCFYIYYLYLCYLYWIYFMPCFYRFLLGHHIFLSLDYYPLICLYCFSCLYSEYLSLLPQFIFLIDLAVPCSEFFTMFLTISNNLGNTSLL